MLAPYGNSQTPFNLQEQTVTRRLQKITTYNSDLMQNGNTRYVWTGIHIHARLAFVKVRDDITNNFLIYYRLKKLYSHILTSIPLRPIIFQDTQQQY